VIFRIKFHFFLNSRWKMYLCALKFPKMDCFGNQEQRWTLNSRAKSFDNPNILFEKWKQDLLLTGTRFNLKSFELKDQKLNIQNCD
jgi:hypothetical protein